MTKEIAAHILDNIRREYNCAESDYIEKAYNTALINMDGEGYHRNYAEVALDNLDDRQILAWLQPKGHLNTFAEAFTILRQK